MSPSYKDLKSLNTVYKRESVYKTWPYLDTEGQAMVRTIRYVTDYIKQGNQHEYQEDTVSWIFHKWLSEFVNKPYHGAILPSLFLSNSFCFAGSVAKSFLMPEPESSAVHVSQRIFTF